MSTTRDFLTFGAAAAATGMAATEFGSTGERGGWLDGRLNRVLRPVSFYATLPAPFALDVFVWGYHVGPAEVDPRWMALSVEAPIGAFADDDHADRVSLGPVLRQHLIIDESTRWTRPPSSPAPAFDFPRGRPTRERDRPAPATRVRMAAPTRLGSDRGASPGMVRRGVLVEVERPSGPAQVLASQAPWAGAHAIWETAELMSDAMCVHVLTFEFLGRAGLDAAPYRALHADLFPRSDFPCRASASPRVAMRPVADRATRCAPGAACHEAEATACPAGAIVGLHDTGTMSPGSGAVPLAGRAALEDALDAREPRSPVDPFGFDAAGGPGFVWHCHIIDREDDEVVCSLAAHR